MTNRLLTTLSTALLNEHYASGFWRDETIYGLVRAHSEAAPDRVAVRSRFHAVTYRALLAAADNLAADMHARGLEPGQRVAVWLPSRIETAVALLACARNGYVCCPSLHRNHTVGEIAELVRRMRARVLICEHGYGADADRHDIAQELAAEDGLKIHVLRPQSAERGELFTLDAAASAASVFEDANGVLYLAFTSGTTGQPKGVMHSNNTLLANARAVVADWSIDADSVIYSLSPLSHNLGFGAMLMALMVGAELVVNDLPPRASILDRIIETGTTYMVGVPTHAIDLLKELDAAARTDVGRLRGFRVSGAAAPRHVVAKLLGYGVVPQSGYGMTEAGSHHYTMPDDDPDLIIGSSGRACRGYEVRIWSQIDPNEELPPNTVGQIGGRGASLMLGYFDDQKATEESFNRSGWFMTGDLGWMDENGYLRITGRKKDVIIRGGHNIFPAHIEELAMRHPAVERVAAIAVPDERLGEKVCLVVMLHRGRSLDGDEMLSFLDDQGLSKFDMPEFFLQVEEVPLTASGKVLKRELMERLKNGGAAPTPVRFRAPKREPVSAGEGGAA